MRLDFSKLSRQDKNQVVIFAPSINQITVVKKAVARPTAAENNSQKQQTDADLIREFMDVDGLTLEEAQAMAAISIKPRPAAEWLALIAELDRAIESYCMAVGLSAGALAELLAVRNRQSLASIPESLAWFKQEWEALREKTGSKGMP